MKNYIKEYTSKIEHRLIEKTFWTEKELETFLVKIHFFQHERFIHLIVTITFGILTTIFMALGMISSIFLIIFAILIIFDLFYIIHYFFLENSVRYLYKLYDQAMERIGQ